MFQIIRNVLFTGNHSLRRKSLRRKPKRWSKNKWWITSSKRQCGVWGYMRVSVWGCVVCWWCMDLVRGVEGVVVSELGGRWVSMFWSLNELFLTFLSESNFDEVTPSLFSSFPLANKRQREIPYWIRNSLFRKKVNFFQMCNELKCRHEMMQLFWGEIPFVHDFRQDLLYQNT